MQRRPQSLPNRFSDDAGKAGDTVVVFSIAPEARGVRLARGPVASRDFDFGRLQSALVMGARLATET